MEFLTDIETCFPSHKNMEDIYKNIRVWHKKQTRIPDWRRGEVIPNYNIASTPYNGVKGDHCEKFAQFIALVTGKNIWWNNDQIQQIDDMS